MADILQVFFEELEYTLGEDEQRFDVSLFGSILDADIGHAITVSGDSVQRYYDDAHERAKDADAPREIFSDRYWVTNDNILTGQVKLRNDNIVSVNDYDVVMVSQVVFYTYYLQYLVQKYPDTTIVAIQDESLTEIASMSATQQRYHMEGLASVDGFVAQDSSYEAIAAAFVEEVCRLPQPIPVDQYDHIDGRIDRSKPPIEVCLGCLPFNAHPWQVYRNIAVADRLRARGYDVEGKIIGVRDWQQDRFAGFESINWITLMPFLDDEEYLSTLGKFDLALHMTPRISAGRAIADYAATGVPCIGNQAVDFQSRCFPETGVALNELATATEIAEHLLTEYITRKRIVNQAQRNLKELQDHSSVRRKLTEYLSGISDAIISG